MKKSSVLAAIIVLLGALGFIAFRVIGPGASGVSGGQAAPADGAGAQESGQAGGGAGAAGNGSGSMAGAQVPGEAVSPVPAAAGATADAAKDAPTAATQPLTVNPPSSDLLREEIAKDAHHAPPSLLKFADSLTKPMELALEAKDDAPARNLFTELAGCSRDAHVAMQARALCMANARRLYRGREAMKADGERLEADADPRVKELVDALNQFGKGTTGP